MDCNNLGKYVMEKFHKPLEVIREVIHEANMDDAEILQWRITALPSGGGSWQPELAINVPKDEKTTMQEVLKRNDAWELKAMLGNNWRYESMKLKGRDFIQIYRASIFPIIPGSYVTESQHYATFHREYVNAPEYRIYSLAVPPSSLVWIGDPHEFIYAPSLEEWKSIAKRRVEAIPIEIRKMVIECSRKS